MGTFFDLPTELVLQILSEVDPIDLLRFSQVCRFANDMLSKRAIWAQALQRLYRRNGLFEPSFQPMSSMDVEGLKKAALRPHQLRSKLLRLSVSADDTPYETGDLALTNHGQATGTCQIIPGGRFVISLGTFSICLWDIGPPGSQMTPVLLDTVQLDGRLERIVSISNPVRASDASDATFRFAVYVRQLPLDLSLNRSVRVYEVGPLERDHRLRLRRELTLDGGASLKRFWISRDRAFVYRNNGMFIVWDFAHSSLTSWPLTLGNDQACYEFVNIGNVIVSLQHNELRAWKIPMLSPIHQRPVSLDALFEAFNEPISVVPFPDHWKRQGTSSSARMLLPSAWGHPSHTSSTVDIIYPPSAEMRSRLTRIRIEVSPNEDKVEAILVSTSESSGFSDLYFNVGVRPYAILGSGLYLVGRLRSQSGGLFIHHSTFDPSGTGINNGEGEGEESLVKWCTLECSVDHRIDTCSLICPYSGRLAYACSDEHEDGMHAVHVVGLLE